MPIIRFPDPQTASPEGVLAVGGDLHPQSLILAYSQGIFPWPISPGPDGEEGHPLVWFCPPERAVIEFSELHIPRSLARQSRRARYRFTIDQAFERVIEACATTPRPDQPGTWITPELKAAYIEFHQLGHAHSVEAWNTETGKLAGGIYGVDAGGAFAGESMFHHEPHASKLALLHLIEHLRARGLDWLDTQVMTPHIEALGAKLILRDDFLRKLARTRARRLRLF